MLTMNRWNKKDTESISKLRRMLYNDDNNENIKLIKDQIQYPEVVGDRRLLRYIRAAKYDILLAKTNYLNTLKFRNEYNVDKIRNEIVFGGKNCPNKFPNGLKILNYFKTIILSSNHRDIDGNPISYEDFSSSPSALLANITKEEYIIFTIYCLEYKSLILEQLSDETERIKINKIINDNNNNNNNNNNYNENDYYGTLHYNTFIRNFTGLGWDHIGNGQTIINWIIQIAISHYPEILGQSHMCNTPFIFEMLWIFIKQFLDNHTLNKVKFYGTDFKSHLLERVSIENFPSNLDNNGTLSFEVNNIPFNFDISPSGPLYYPGQPDIIITNINNINDNNINNIINNESIRRIESHLSLSNDTTVKRIESNQSIASNITDTGGSYIESPLLGNSIFRKSYKSDNMNNHNNEKIEESCIIENYQSISNSNDSYDSIISTNEEEDDESKKNIIIKKESKFNIINNYINNFFIKIISLDLISDFFLILIVLFDSILCLFMMKECDKGRKDMLLKSPKVWLLYILIVSYGKIEYYGSWFIQLCDTFKDKIINLFNTIESKNIE